MSVLLLFAVFFPMIAAIADYIIGRKNKKLRDYFADGVTGIEFGVFLFFFIRIIMNGETSVSASVPGICGFGLHFAMDGFRAFYGCIAAFMWFMSTLFSREYFAHYRNRNRYYLFLLITLGATEGVFLSADFYTVFFFFEIMSFTSYVWVAHDERTESLRAASTYLGVAVIGGLVMLMGIFLLYHVCGTLNFEKLEEVIREYRLVLSSDKSVPGAMNTIWIAGLCMLFGFGAKAGAFPLHIWLPKAHPAAPAPASALLSGILTKAGMFGILVLNAYVFFEDITWGSLILILGVCTMVTGAVLALFSVDLKRTLACSSVSQIGFILVGVGMSGLLGEENVLAVRGSFLHMVNHSLIKLALFMAAGVVFMNVHKLNLNEIRGFGRKKPLLNYIFLMGALGIGGVPLFNGYISKTLIHESILEYMEVMQESAETGIFSMGAMKGIEWSFLLSGGLTVAYMTKLYMAVFVEKNENEDVQEKFDSLKGNYMNKVSGAALAVSATLLPILGFLPNLTMSRIADIGQGFLRCRKKAPEIAWFSFENLKGAIISLGVGALVYLVVVRFWLMKKEGAGKVYVDRWWKYLDLENMVYRPVLLRLLPFVFGKLCKGLDIFADALAWLARRAFPFVSGIFCRVLDSLVDGTVVFLRKTVYKDSRIPQELEEGNYFTHVAGSAVNGIERAANATFWRKKPRNVDYEHKYAMAYEELSEDKTIIGRSLSFGLLLFCVGLIITVVYLLF